MMQDDATLGREARAGFTLQEGWSTRFIRDRLLEVLSSAVRGRLVLKERGRLIGDFGDRNDPLQAEIDVLDLRCYRRALLGGDVAAGEAFVDGWWTSPDLTCVTRFFSRNLETMDAWTKQFGWMLQPLSWIRLLRRSNFRNQARHNILSHYDLGNRLYASFLDPHMQYSSGLFLDETDTLDQAQRNKMSRLCECLELKPGDRLLEIGTGWGGLALFAAGEYGCHVTTTTISDAQHRYTSRLIKKAGLDNRITLLNKDYRDLEGSFDKLVSVEMIEAVGKRFLPSYFKKLNDLLNPGGLAAIQAITIADQRFSQYCRNEDFIQKHVFPGGFLPTLQLMTRLIATETELVVRDLHDMGLDYARTIQHWRQNFLSQRETLESLGYDEKFRRLWEYYLGYCEGGFLERRISAVQLLASKAPHRTG